MELSGQAYVLKVLLDSKQLKRANGVSLQDYLTCCGKMFLLQFSLKYVASTVLNVAEVVHFLFYFLSILYSTIL